MNPTKVPLLILVVATTMINSIRATPESCAANINNLLMTVATYATTNQTDKILSMPIFTYSGKDLNDLGSYELCKRTPNVSYITLALTPKGTADRNDGMDFSTVRIGICGPANCTAEDYKNETVQATFQTIIAMASMMTKFNISSLFSTMKFTPVNPDGGPKITFSSVLAFIVVAIPTLLLIIGSARVHFENSFKRKKLDGVNKSDIESSEAPIDDAYRELRDADVEPEKPKTLWIKVLDCWAIQDNFKQVFYPDVNPKHDTALNIFNGVRVLSTLWVILGHEYMVLLGYASNYKDLGLVLNQKFTNIISSGLFAVDTFFFIGGFFSAFVLYSKLKPMKVGFASYGSVLLHRIIRIWPVYMFALLLWWKLSVYWGSGPIWASYLDAPSKCDTNWWRNMLFIDAWYKGNDQCMNWGWYLSDDLQMFLVAPLIIWLFFKSPKQAYTAIAVLLTISLSLGLYYAISDEIQAGILGSANIAYWNHTYTNPFVRIPVYLVGMALALEYRSLKQGDEGLKKISEKIRSSVVISWGIELIGIGLISMLVWLPDTIKTDLSVWPDWFHRVFMTFQRFIFGIGLALIVMPTLFGAKTAVRFILSAGFWAPLAALTFSTYLTHVIPIEWKAFSSRATMYFDHNNAIWETITSAFMSLLCGLVIYLVMEAPIGKLEGALKSSLAKKGKGNSNGKAVEPKL